MTDLPREVLSRGAALDFGGSLIGVRTTTLPTGLPTWDAACTSSGEVGLGHWWYVVIGGASNSGKTRLMLHLARRAAFSGLRPGIITMEVSRQNLQRQLYGEVTSFTFQELLPSRWGDGDSTRKSEQLADEVEEYAEQGRRSIRVAETGSSPSLAGVLDLCEALSEAGCDCIFVDHLQLIRAPSDMIADRAADVSEALRVFAHDRECLVVALSQLNRMASRDRRRAPTMHDLWGGTAIESNANMVALIDHSNYDRDPIRHHLVRTWLLIDKNREGPAGLRIPVEINFDTGVWREGTDDEVAAWPNARE